MSCVFVVVLVLALTASVVCPSDAVRIPRELQLTGGHKVFLWGEGHILAMHDNGTVQLKPARSHNCGACDVDLKFLCREKNIAGCPKRRRKHKQSDKLTPTLVMMQFVSAGKYLCMNQNATFYVLADPDDYHVEECAFYLVNRSKSNHALLYHFKYPEKKRNCRLSERRKNARKLCVKYFLRKGNDGSLVAFKDKFFKESRWLPIPKDFGKQNF